MDNSNMLKGASSQIADRSYQVGHFSMPKWMSGGQLLSSTTTGRYPRAKHSPAEWTAQRGACQRAWP